MAHIPSISDHEFSHEPVWGRVLTWLLAVGLALFLVLALVGGPDEARAAGRTLFGWDEKRFPSIQPVTKWRGTLDRSF